MSSVTEISGCLNAIAQNREHWAWGYLEEKGYWKIKHSGTMPPCEIYLELSGPSLCMQVEMGNLRVLPECRAALSFFLLRLNEDIPVVKFGMRSGGKITLMAEAVTAQLSLATLEELLQALIAVFVQYRREIVLLAEDPELAEVVMKLFAAVATSPVKIVVVKREEAAK